MSETISVRDPLMPIMVNEENGNLVFIFDLLNVIVIIQSVKQTTYGYPSLITVEYPTGTPLRTSIGIDLADPRKRQVTAIDLARQCPDDLPWGQIIETISQEGIKYCLGHTDKPNAQKQTPIIRNLVDIEAQTVKWLWHPYIPFGKLTLLEGDPGVGKSWLSLAIITAISLGRGLPGQADLAYGPCMMASAEDGLGDTIKPRLAAMGADISVIRAVDGLFTLDDGGFQWLEDKILEDIPILLVIDPLIAYLSGDMDINKANQVRYATARLAHLADTYGIAIIAVRHLTKGGSSKPIYRGLGSIDFTAAARSVLLAGQDPDKPQIRAFTHIKSNLAITGQPIGYEIKDGNFYWLEHTELTTERILAGFDNNSDKPALDEAKTFLIDILTNGECTTKDIFADAKSQGISEITLKRAKKELNITAYRTGEKGREGGGKWYWKPPTPSKGIMENGT